MNKNGSDNSNDPNVVDMKTARERLAHERKEQAVKDLRKQFQKAMGWKNLPKPKPPAGRKGPPEGGPGKGPGKGSSGGRRKKK